ncbi:MAG TPA: hypothetical protein PLA83_08690 [Deltaproteobacteria bacterium]|nr:hypothetical protein [Deltaproteobacteria bacterium]HQI02208.1 hypothetical protein [Deltaproteobacteria bacterium]
MKFLRIYHVFVIAVLCAGILPGCSDRPTESSTVPAEIIGVWTTQNQESAGVSIEFKERSVIISSDLGVVENSVTKVKSEKGAAGGSTLYSISYSDKGGKTNLMEVVYFPEQEGTIRFKSDPSMAWKKSK